MVNLHCVSSVVAPPIVSRALTCGPPFECVTLFALATFLWSVHPHRQDDGVGSERTVIQPGHLCDEGAKVSRYAYSLEKVRR